MAEIDPRYTERLIQQGDRVENQLVKQISNIEFRRQGSVTNNTHIRAESDVDILVITSQFETLQSPQQPTYPFQGNTTQTILLLLKDCVDTLRSSFPQANIDDSGSFSIAASGGSLLCKVDVVPSNWYNSNKYAATKDEVYRGIRVFNKKKKVFSENYPFLTNFRLKEKDRQHQNKLCMCIRLIKNMKVDAKREYAISSYDICSLIYRGSDDMFSASKAVTDITNDLWNWLYYLSQHQGERRNLMVIDESRKIFDTEEKEVSLSEIVKDLGTILVAANSAKGTS